MSCFFYNKHLPRVGERRWWTRWFIKFLPERNLFRFPFAFFFFYARRKTYKFHAMRPSGNGFKSFWFSFRFLSSYFLLRRLGIAAGPPIFSQCNLRQFNGCFPSAFIKFIFSDGTIGMIYLLLETLSSNWSWDWKGSKRRWCIDSFTGQFLFMAPIIGED